jgi:hypothetical protein
MKGGIMQLKTFESLDALRSTGVKEGEKWEFKSTWPASLNVEKTICAFANTAGGIIVIGVDYDNTSNQIAGFPGIDKARGLEEKAIDIGGNINPRIIPASWLVDVPSGRVVQVIEVFKSRMIPHMASNYIYYQRVDKESVPLPESLVERLYLARQVQQKEVNAFLREKEYFKFPGEPHWLSICFCPLYLEPDLISHSRSNLDLLNSLRDIIDPEIVNVFFRSMPEGYRWEIPQHPKIGKALYDRLVQILNNGVLAFGMWIEYDEPYWTVVEIWFKRMISLYRKLQTNLRYPGWTRIILLLTKMRDVKMVFPDYKTDSRMYKLSRPMIQGDLLIENDFEDSDISNDPEKVFESFYTKVKVNYGLDEYIA